MADRIVKPDTGNDLVVQNDDASAKIEINEDGSIPVTGTFDVSSATLTTSSAQKQAIVQAGPGSGTLDVSSGTFTTSSAQKQAIVQAGPGSGTLDVSSGTFTTSTAQKQAIVDGATIEAQDLASGSGTTLPNNVQDNITRLGTVTSGTFSGTLGSVTFPAGMVIKAHYFQHRELPTVSSNSANFTVPAGSSASDASAIVLYSQTVQITGITATENNKLIISANAGDLFAQNDGTYQSNQGFIIDGTYYNCSGSYGNLGSTGYHTLPVRPMMVFTVPASFTSKTISCACFRESGGSGTFTVQARGATADSGYNISMTVLEVQT